MRKRFDDILNECIRRLEASGGDIETVLSKYPEHTDELRPYLEVWRSLSAVEKAQASSAGAMRGRQQLLTAIARAEQAEQGVRLINSLARKGGLSMNFGGIKFAGMFVAGVVLALGITFLTGSLEFGGDSSTLAQEVAKCVEGLDNNGDGDLNVEDVQGFQDALENQDPGFDVDGDTDVDINDVVQQVNDVIDCLQQLQEP